MLQYHFILVIQRADSYTIPNKNLHFRIGSLFPAPGQAAKFMQVYFLSTADQFTRRRSIFEGLRPELIQILTNIMNEFNPYVTQFKSAVSVIRNSVIPNLKAINTIYYVNFKSSMTLHYYQKLLTNFLSTPQKYNS